MKLIKNFLREIREKGTKVFKNDWYKATERFNEVEEFSHLVDINEIELYKLFFDREVEQYFLIAQINMH